jgi:hypothetical protein
LFEFLPLAWDPALSRSPGSTPSIEGKNATFGTAPGRNERSEGFKEALRK